MHHLDSLETFFYVLQLSPCLRSVLRIGDGQPVTRTELHGNSKKLSFCTFVLTHQHAVLVNHTPVPWQKNVRTSLVQSGVSLDASKTGWL